MPLDPATRYETWVLVRVGKNQKGVPVRYRRARFNLVEFDGVPEQYIEPLSASPVADLTDAVVNPTVGAMVRIERYDEQPFEVHDFSDTGL